MVLFVFIASVSNLKNCNCAQNIYGYLFKSLFSKNCPEYIKIWLDFKSQNTKFEYIWYSDE